MVGVQKRKLQWAISLFLVMLYFTGLTSQAQYGGGSGEPNDQYLIYTAEQMNAIGANPNDWDKHFKLMADIDLSGYVGGARSPVFNIIGYWEDWVWVDWRSPDSKPFIGVFDGNGHTISNFSYTSTDTDYIGLFGYVDGENALIKDLGLIYPNVDAGTGNDVGSLVGELWKGTVTGCYVKGGIVLAGSSVGGLVGHNYDGTITDCNASASVSGENTIGGLVGYNYLGGTISNCYSSGDVSGSRTVWWLGGDGGLVGWNRGIVSNCYATGSVDGDKKVGGLVGENGDKGTINNCYSSGDISGYASVGGLVGENYGAVTDSFWDTQTSRQVTSDGGTGKTTAEMKDPNTFIVAGWNFVDAPDGPHDIWAEPDGGGYPVLWWQLSELPELPFSGGTGELDNPYLISTSYELNSIGHNPRLMRAHFKLTNDIDLAGIDFYIIGSEAFPFTSVFDGNGFMISNFSYTSTDRDYVGLFGYVDDANAEIKDLGLIDPNIDAGAGDTVGLLVGWLWEGSITNCYAQGGSVSGNAAVGGLLGHNYDGTITNCYATGSILGNTTVGGLVGSNLGTITNCYVKGSILGNTTIGGLVGALYSGTIANCYSTGSVSGLRSLGGLVGFNFGTITNCYSSGSVMGNYYTGGLVGGSWAGTITNSFWDIEISGQLESVAGTGLSTRLMQDIDTYLNAGWDVVEETENGTDYIWWILEGQDYPRLWWELIDDVSPVIDDDVSPVIDLVISNPIPDERFVRGEEISFRVIVSSQLDLDGFQLKWTSNKDGDLGTGLELTLDNLSTGSHVIQVCGYEVCTSISVRIYEDLWQLYQSPPAEGEIERILNDFSFNLIDGDESDEKWDAYAPVFDQNSIDPSFLVAISKIDILRHQRFSAPVPFTNGQTIYDHFKTYVKTINLKLDCSYNSAGGDRVNLNRNFSVWDGRVSGTPSNWDACKIPFPNHSLYDYTNPIYLLMHEVRHCEPSDPRHQMCDGRAKDEMLEDGGGYAQSALYLMWVYKYSLYDPPFIRSEAGSSAAMFLNRFLCTTPTHSDPNVQAIIDELLN